MTAELRCTESTLSINFKRFGSIRREANGFEDKLKGHYLQPQVIGVPDDLDPNIPRLVFSSLNGFSHVIVSQVTIQLAVRYSEDYQRDPGLRARYIGERLTLLFDVIEGMVPRIDALFTGYSTRFVVPSREVARRWMNRIAPSLSPDPAGASLFDATQKRVTTEGGRYYCNLTAETYRVFTAQNLFDSPVPAATAIEEGVAVACDFNDRYAFNEIQGYRTHREAAQQIMMSGDTRAHELATFLAEGREG